MKTHLPHTAGAAALLVLAFAGCASEPSSGYYRASSTIGYDSRGNTVAYGDDYDYYPGYEVYYARNRHEYVYRDGNRWVRSSTYPRASSQVLLSSPSVRVEFRDAPERHHDYVVRRYPHDWRQDRDHDGRRDWRDDNHNGINDYDEREIGRDRR
jgi:hypothetical protein